MITFTGDLAFLSNFYPSRIYVVIDGRPLEAKTLEHAYQASKTSNPDGQDRVLEARTPGMAKRLGQLVKLRPGWDDLKVPLMESLLRLKFTQHFDLRKKLLSVDPEYLIEYNEWHDNFWGSCTCNRCQTRFPEGGQNHLGRLLKELQAFCGGEEV